MYTTVFTVNGKMLTDTVRHTIRKALKTHYIKTDRRRSSSLTTLFLGIGAACIMKFTFTEKKMDSSDELRAYAVKKISKLDRFFKQEADAYVTFSIEHGRFLAEITIHNNGLYYRASELTNDMYASIDSGVAAIERQIRRNKTRLAKRLREGSFDKEVHEPAFMPEEKEDEEFKVVRSKKFTIEPMTVEEAILQMNLLDHEFFLFKNMDEHGAVSAVYKRRNGGYGLICDDGE